MRRGGWAAKLRWVMPLRFLIVDDNASFRQEMRGLLEEQGLDMVGSAADTAEALEQMAELGPDVVLIDIDLGEESGLALAEALHVGGGRSLPRVILISTHDERDYADLIEASPAVGFLSKTELSAAEICRVLADAEASETGRTS
jgi:DNA-binding NarL/FixJ family response regulator